MTSFRELHRWNQGEKLVVLGEERPGSLNAYVEVRGRKYVVERRKIQGIPGEIDSNSQRLKDFLLHTDVTVSPLDQGQYSITIFPHKESVPRRVDLDLVSFIPEEAKVALREAMQVKDKDVVMLVGVTGVGKSSLANDLLGSDLEVVDGKVRVRKGHIEHALIGHQLTQSCTLFTKNYRSKKGFFLSDAGGFLDTRGVSSDVLVALSILFTIRASLSIRFIICMDQKSVCSDRGQRFKEIVSSFFRLVGNDMSAMESVIFLITKWEGEDAREKILAEIQEHIDELTCDDQRKIYQRIIREGGKYLYLYDPRTRQSREDILTLLTSLESVSDVKKGHIYSTRVEDKLKDPIHRFCRKMSGLYDQYKQLQAEFTESEKERKEIDNALQSFSSVESLEKQVEEIISSVDRKGREISRLEENLRSLEAQTRTIDEEEQRHERMGEEEVLEGGYYRPKQTTTVEREKRSFIFFKRKVYEEEEQPLKELFTYRGTNPVLRIECIPPQPNPNWSIPSQKKDVYEITYTGLLGPHPHCELKIFVKRRDTSEFKERSLSIQKRKTTVMSDRVNLQEKINREKEELEDLENERKEVEDNIRVSKKSEKQLRENQSELDRNLAIIKEKQPLIEKDLQEAQSEVDALKECLSILGESFMDDTIKEFMTKEALYPSTTPNFLKKVAGVGNSIFRVIARFSGF